MSMRTHASALLRCPMGQCRETMTWPVTTAQKKPDFKNFAHSCFLLLEPDGWGMYDAKQKSTVLWMRPPSLPIWKHAIPRSRSTVRKIEIPIVGLGKQDGNFVICSKFRIQIWPFEF